MKVATLLLTLMLSAAAFGAEEPKTPEVWIEGSAVETKIGCCILPANGAAVFIDGLNFWPDGFYEGGPKGKRVVSHGFLVERYDLPVYEAKPGEPPQSGIPVPPGTDMHKAKRRLLQILAEWDEWRISTDPFRNFRPVDVYYTEDGGLTAKGAGGPNALAVFHVAYSTPIKKLTELIKQLGGQGFGTVKMDFLPDPKS